MPSQGKVREYWKTAPNGLTPSVDVKVATPYKTPQSVKKVCGPVDSFIPISWSLWFFNKYIMYPVSYAVQNNAHIFMIDQWRDIPEWCTWWSRCHFGAFITSENFIIPTNYERKLFIKSWNLIWGLLYYINILCCATTTTVFRVSVRRG